MEKVELFVEETLRDRGQMTREEYDAFFAMLLMRDNEPSSEVFEKSKARYDQSGFDFDDCQPMGLGWKTLWIAVRTIDIVGLIGTLASSFIVEQKECSVEETYYDARPSDAFANMTQNRYFRVTQPCDGTVFVQPHVHGQSTIWDAFLDARKKRQTASLAIQTPCSEISKNFGDVYLFWSQRVIGNHGFILWKNGKIRRTISTSQREDTNYGDALVGEENYNGSLDMEWDDRPLLNEDSLFEMAGRWKVNPNYVNPIRPGERAYCWFVDARDWQ